MGTTTYITNPPPAEPVCTQDSPPSAGFAPPSNYIQVVPATYPGQPANAISLGLIGSIIASSIQPNQDKIDQFNQACINWQATQLAAWNNAGQPTTWTNTAPAPNPADYALPMGDFPVVWDPNVSGQAWFGLQSTTELPGSCPPFVPPVVPSNTPYITALMGTYDIGGVLTAVFSIMAGKDTVKVGATVNLFTGLPYGPYVYNGQFGNPFPVVKQGGAFGASYYFGTVQLA